MYVCMCVCVCMHVCMCVCMYICIFYYLFIYLFIYLFTGMLHYIRLVILHAVYIWCLQSLFLLYSFFLILRLSFGLLLVDLLGTPECLFHVMCSFLWFYLTVAWIWKMLCSVFWWACLYLWASYLLQLLRLLGVLCLCVVLRIRVACVPLFDCHFRMGSLLRRWF